MELDHFLAMLEKVSNDYATHYVMQGRIYASVYNKVSDLAFKAHIGDDDMTTPFSFTYTGPIAIIYLDDLTQSKEMPLNTALCVIAIMSAVTFADVSLFDKLNPKIFPTQVGQYDVGDPELFDLARRLICHHTKEKWEEDFLTKQYRAQQEAASEYFARLTD